MPVKILLINPPGKQLWRNVMWNRILNLCDQALMAKTADTSSNLSAMASPAAEGNSGILDFAGSGVDGLGG